MKFGIIIENDTTFIHLFIQQIKKRTVNWGISISCALLGFTSNSNSSGGLLWKNKFESALDIQQADGDKGNITALCTPNTGLRVLASVKVCSHNKLKKLLDLQLIRSVTSPCVFNNNFLLQ